MKCGHRMRLALLSLALSWASGRVSAQAPEPAQSATLTNRMVVSIRIVTQNGRVLSESPEGLAIRVGQPLDASALREVLRQLYRTGDYADLQAVLAELPGGVRLDFVVRENLFFNEIRFEGLVSPPSEASAAAAMQINLGQPYRKELLDEALVRLQDALREEGFYNAKLSAETIPHADTLQMDVVVHVQPGRRARAGTIQVVNDTEYPDRELIARSRLKPGQEITTARLQRAGDRVRKFLAKKGHLSARASIRRSEYIPEKNAVPLDLEITEGPLVRVVVTGAKLSHGKIRSLVPVYQEGAVDPDLLEEGRRNILEQLERDTYFDARVTYTTEQKEISRKTHAGPSTEELITYRVERGERHHLIGIEITGNRYFSDELLRGRLKLLADAFASRGRFSRGLLESDRQSMQSLYLANGFENAKVEAQALDDYKGKEGDLLVRFRIQEGQQTRVASLSIEGNHAFSKDELLGVIGSTPGQPYSEFNVASDRDNILARYFNEGFPQARFQASMEKVPPAEASAQKSGQEEKDTTPSNGNHSKAPVPAAAEEVRLTYHIDEGLQIRVKRLLLSGYHYTRPGVIRRHLLVRAGEPLRQGEVVESQRELYNLGIFNRVTIEPQNPSGTDPQKNVVALVEEAKRYTLGYGGGLEVQRLASSKDPTQTELRASPRGILELSKMNLTGRGDTLALKVRASTLQGRALLGYFSPDTFAKKSLSFQATAYAEKTQDINTFTEDRYEGSVQLTERISSRTTLLYHYAFRKVLVSNLNKHISPEEIPLFNAPTLVSEFGVTWFRDHRDNPADATRGTFNNFDFSLADTGLGSSASFLRFFTQNATYHPIKRRFSFARSFRFGILQPYRDTVSLAFPAPTTLPLPTLIPLPERFFAGGGNSLRGFALNQAGPRDAATGFPVGGQAELILNQEFRFPMRVPKFGTQLGGALFYDAGNIYSRLTRMTFRMSPPAPVFSAATTTAPMQCIQNCSNELNYFSHTIGFGVRYATPVGPVRIDLGYQLNRATFVVPIPCPPGTPASTTNCGQQPAHLPRFQIFFNLGAPF